MHCSWYRKKNHLPIQLFREKFGNWSELSTLQNTYCPSSFYKKTRKKTFKTWNFLKLNCHGLLFFSREEKPLWGKVGLRFHSTKVAREKRKLPVKKIKFLPVKIIFCPWKNNKKPWNCPWKKKVGREKSWKKAKKCPWKNKIAREKMDKMAKNGFHGQKINAELGWLFIKNRNVFTRSLSHY